MKPRVLILLAGDLIDFPLNASEWNLIIAADSGASHALKQGIIPDHLIGDFDSITPHEFNIVLGSSKIWSFPTDKDYTDGELALRKALELHPKEVVIAGGLGRRLDHTIANVFLLNLLAEYSIPGYLTNGKERVYLVISSLKLKSTPGQRISIIPLSLKLEVKKATGLKWSLQNDTLYFGSTRGISNESISDEIHIEISQGRALIIQSIIDKD